MFLKVKIENYLLPLIIFLAISTRLLVSSFQIDWDEEVYWWAGKLWFDGRLPYVSIFDHKPALIYFLNGIFSELGIEFYRAFFGIALLLVFYFVAKLIHSGSGALISTASFSLFFAMPGGMLGVNTEVAYLLFELASIFFFCAAPHILQH